MAAPKKGKLSREEAIELYGDLQKAMATMLKNNPEGAPPPGASGPGPARPARPAPAASASARPGVRHGDKGGQTGALVAIAAFASARLVLGVLETAGVGTLAATPAVAAERALPAAAPVSFGSEDVEVLKALDARRAELEERARRLDEREEDFRRRDREFAVRLTQIRELTSRLQTEREKDEKRQDDRIAQLAGVYGSMNPPEAAALIAQLDTTTALSLVRRMPEKRIGQILALMTSEKALVLTKMLSESPGATP